MSSLEDKGHPYKNLKDMHTKCQENPVIAHLNRNSIRNKFCELKDLITSSSLDIVVLSETKIDNTFPISQFQIPGYKAPYREGRNAHGGGLLVYIRNSIKSKRINSLEENQIEIFFCIQNLQ